MQQRSRLLRRLDWPTVLIYIILVFLGWLNIYAAVFSEEHQSIIDLSQRYGMQLVWIGAAFIIGLTVLLVDSRFYQVFAYYFYAILIIILLFVLVFGVEVNASRSWIQLGGVRIQPAEFAKFATALALAKLMSAYGFKLLRFKSIFRIGIILVLPMGLILLQNDTGSALVYAAFILVLYREGLPHWFMGYLVFLVGVFIASLVFNKFIILVSLFILTMLVFTIITRRYKVSFQFTVLVFGLVAALYGLSEFFELKISWYFMLLIPICIGVPLALVYSYINKLKEIVLLLGFLLISATFAFSVDYIFHNVLERHHRERINDLLGIESDPLGWGYNVNQSKIAIGSGGVWGKGYLKGTQTKYNFVPEQSTDFIFCTVGEEWGFVGSAIVISLFLYFLIRLIRIAERQKEHFARIYGYGVVSIFFFHIAINIGMTIGLFPVIGIPLPFFSYGGSSLWAFTILLFIFLKFDSSRLD
ncbi:MAG TPA: rod shape-determining protein RodA [Tenuifilaceae bacterium]|nr:rod shape-determining protein RodA [Tenuifilaceae bacterium]HPE17827.1 rod shape-determining protein RodA [Tenuifilaceae bacterium]HPJ45275.1 rod shape-determining protein RodA [Tenuifilaceae bacterium]HPQ33623.1 rod shape-determining protein RodA [Tenuifilaceae bacterium]HRX67311.1 rod shape-determining protein RodA [Tenuifilaceae bacterium]